MLRLSRFIHECGREPRQLLRVRGRKRSRARARRVEQDAVEAEEAVEQPCVGAHDHDVVAAELAQVVFELLGARVIELPAIRIADPADKFEAIDAAISLLASYDWLIFTSANGVTRFFDRLYAARKDARSLSKAHIAAIGTATAAKLKSYGIIADVVPSEFRAEAMITALKGEVAPGERVLIPRATEAREILPQSLRDYGAIVDVAPVYETLPSGEDPAPVIEMLKNKEIDFATFASSSTVKNLVKMTGDASLLKNTKVVAIGPVTAKTCADLGIDVFATAKEYTIDGLVNTVIENA